jgi:hypothetical protein
MLNFGICASIVSALLAGNIPASTAPVVWSDDCIRVSHAAEIVSSDRGLMYIQTEDGNIWGVYGALDASRLYAVVFDTNGTDNIEDDRVLLAVAMD